MNAINKPMRSVALADVKLNEGLLGDKNKLIRTKVIPYQWQALNDEIAGVIPSHAIKNFRIAAGEIEGEFGGMVFQDSDVAKWLEAVAYQLATYPDPELEALADQVIEWIGGAQQSDGYLNTYYTLVEPGKRWTNLAECHELYCAGHMMEAAVAYYQATGKNKLLNIISHFADLIEATFGTEPGKRRGYPGHPEIELALIKLYRATGRENYLQLVKYFIDERGREPYYFDLEWETRGKMNHWPNFRDMGRAYFQAHQPVREQQEAAGHAVRAVYLYSGMADLAVETGDRSLMEACQRLWQNTVKKQMYITGGIGSSGHGEAFTFDYDLPNNTAYTETCAAIGLIFWAQRMLRLEWNSEYADVIEKALYNGVLSGISEDGERFFYVNPLEVWPKACENRHDTKHVKPTRQKWFGCACCPPNIARLLASIGQYIYSTVERGAYVHLYTNSSIKFTVNGKNVTLTQETNYPWGEKVVVNVWSERDLGWLLALRIPGWCRNFRIALNGEAIEPLIKKGYIVMKRVWKKGDQIELVFDMPVERVYSNPEVRENAGKVAIQRGPIVYCLEEIDHGPNLPAITLPRDSELIAQYDENLLGGLTLITGEAFKISMTGWEDKLYGTDPLKEDRVNIKLIPYYAWDNREPGEMVIWIREK